MHRGSVQNCILLNILNKILTHSLNGFTLYLINNKSGMNSSLLTLNFYISENSAASQCNSFILWNKICLSVCQLDINRYFFFSVCKYFVSELQERLANSSRSKEVIETGHGLDTKKKRVPYKYS